MAIYIAAKVRGGGNLLETFKKELGSREALVNELNKYAGGEADSKKSSQIQTTLEVNLMLAFLFLAGLLCKLPLLEKDILVGAQKNLFGYLTEYQET